MSRAITVRLDEEDHSELTRQAAQLKLRPGALARILLHAGLENERRPAGAAQAAIERLVRRSREQPPADAMDLVNDARESLGSAR